METKPTRYAFIDVQNTEGTVKLLGFVVDWHKLYHYLFKDINDWKMRVKKDI